MKKLQWSKLTDTQRKKMGGGCGPGKAMLFIPQFIFKASCEQHDFYYRRGGTIFDKAEADVMFFAFMLKDIADSPKHWTKKLLYVAAAKIYFILVSVFGYFAFTFGHYRTLRELYKSQ